MAESNKEYTITSNSGIVQMSQAFNGNDTLRDVIKAYLKTIDKSELSKNTKQICKAFYSIQDGKDNKKHSCFALLANGRHTLITTSNADKKLNELFPNNKTLTLALNTPTHKCTNEQTFQVIDVRGNKHSVYVSVEADIDISQPYPKIKIYHLTEKLKDQRLWNGNTQYITVNGQEYASDHLDEAITEANTIEIKQKKVNIEHVTGPNHPHFWELDFYGKLLQRFDVCVTDVAGAKKILQENDLLNDALTNSFNGIFENHTGSIIMVPAFLCSTTQKQGFTYILLYQNNDNQVESWTPFWPGQTLGGKLYSTIDGKPRTGYRYGNYLRYSSIGEYEAVCKWPVGTIGTELPAAWEVDKLSHAIQRLKWLQQSAKYTKQYNKWRQKGQIYNVSSLQTSNLANLVYERPSR